jgi:hypothetical protein
LPECLDDCIDESNPVRVIDLYVDALNLSELGFATANGFVPLAFSMSWTAQSVKTMKKICD